MNPHVYEPPLWDKRAIHQRKPGQCAHPVHDRYLGEIIQCRRKPVQVFNGLGYCGQHAKIVARDLVPG